MLAVNIASGFAQVQARANTLQRHAAGRCGKAGPQRCARAPARQRHRNSAGAAGLHRAAGVHPAAPGSDRACAERRTLTLLGRSWQLPGSGALPEDVPPRVRWLPLRLGRLALPGCVQETTCWARETQEQTFTPETAAALARRSARLQLLQDYPDAVIESERDFASTTATAAVCRAVFVFCANIAEPRSAPAASG